MSITLSQQRHNLLLTASSSALIPLLQSPLSMFIPM